MTSNGNTALPLRVGDFVQILSGRTGRIEAIEGEELQIVLDSGGTVYKAAYAVDLVQGVNDGSNGATHQSQAWSRSKSPK